ncbi:MAG: hypothetical protein V1811_02645 [Candidatus Micrarchaeota archaeon]
MVYSEKIEIIEDRNARLRSLLHPVTLAIFIIAAAAAITAFYFGQNTLAGVCAFVGALIPFYALINPMQRMLIEDDGVTFPAPYNVKISFSDISQVKAEGGVLKVWLKPDAKTRYIKTMTNEHPEIPMPNAERLAEINKYAGANIMIAGGFDFKRIKQLLDSRL